MLSGYVCIVTGASRGIGKGIALQLGEAGAKVYITGRTLENKDGTPGSLRITADEVSARGGQAIPIQCDHSKDSDIDALFNRVKSENSGRLDILVNNAYSAVNAILENTRKKFWETPVSMWDEVNQVGLRNHYICAWHAAQLMVPQKRGLIVNISSAGGLRYLFNVPYGIGKEACDRMAADCGHELRRHNVAFVSLWPGAVMTETIGDHMSEIDANDKRTAEAFRNGETVEFSGKCIVYLAKDTNLMAKTGRILLTSELAKEYGFTDIDGKSPSSLRSISGLMAYAGHTWAAAFIPGWLNIPRSVFAMAGSKF